MRYILLSYTVHREGDQYVSLCRELDISSCGSTVDEALQKALDATQLYLTTLEDLGECLERLSERGVRVLDKPSGVKLPVPSRPGQLFAGVFPVQSACA